MVDDLKVDIWKSYVFSLCAVCSQLYCASPRLMGAGYERENVTETKWKKEPWNASEIRILFVEIRFVICHIVYIRLSVHACNIIV